MSGRSRPLSLKHLCASLLLVLGLFGCSAAKPPTRPTGGAAPTAPALSAPTAPAATNGGAPVVTVSTGSTSPTFPVMLGIDVLESQGFAAVKGKRIGLLTHPAGVNRRGESTIDVLRRAPGVKLVALYGPEHGIYGDEAAEVQIPDRRDKRTGLPVFSIYGKYQRPTKGQLKNLDAMVIDLQDIGSRSYTFVSAMRYTMEACFENNVEVIILDRPNPLGGLKVDGPPLDAKWTSYVGAFRVPYVHGLTIGELAKMAKEAPGVLAVSDAVRQRGRLTVVPMRGWRRSMRWTETGLTWVPTSAYIQDFAAVLGYPMVGLGAFWNPPKIDTGFRHGIGKSYPFRGLSHRSVKIDQVEKELRALGLAGLQFRRVSAPDRDGKPAVGLFIEITDYDDWRPTELNFHLLRLACKFDPKGNPFTPGPGRDFSGFLRHMGSEEFLRALQRDGAKVDVAKFLADWAARDKIYQEQSKKYWLYR
ncbi:MAG TPA: DUF1343 domain-containing protein [Opitutaceae bacterium]|nr:DUF1343 domain-containing protein [Opitutaceae bacterium]